MAGALISLDTVPYKSLVERINNSIRLRLGLVQMIIIIWGVSTSIKNNEPRLRLQASAPNDTVRPVTALQGQQTQHSYDCAPTRGTSTCNKQSNGRFVNLQFGKIDLFSNIIDDIEGRLDFVYCLLLYCSFIYLLLRPNKTSFWAFDQTYDSTRLLYGTVLIIANDPPLSFGEYKKVNHVELTWSCKCQGMHDTATAMVIDPGMSMQWQHAAAWTLIDAHATHLS